MKQKKKYIGKVVITAVIIALLVSSISAINVTQIEADERDVRPLGDVQSGIKTAGWDEMYPELELGDSITLMVWGNVYNENWTGYVMYNLSWGPDVFQPGIINVSHVTNGNAGLWTLFDAGTKRNSSGNLSNTQGTLLANNVTGNYSLFNVTFDTVSVGFCYLNFSYVTKFGVWGLTLLDELGAPFSDLTFTNNTLRVYPVEPASLTATRYNYTAVNLTFAPGNGGSNVTLCGKEGSYPTGPTDSVIYNGSLTQYNDTGLDPCTTYYYRAWTWNETYNYHSDDYQSAIATTQCYTNFTFQGVVPANQTTLSNCSSYNVVVNLTINDSRGRAFSWWINCSDGTSNSGTGASNGSKTVTMSGLNHNQKYYWNVTASDETGTGDSYSANYEFTTGRGGGTAPGTPSSPVPTTATTSIPYNWGLFECDVTDADGDLLNVTFYWSNGTAIGTDTFVASGGTASITPTLTLDNDTTYSWYVYSNDTCQQTRGPSSGYWTFTTDSPSADITKDCEPSITNHSIRYIINVTNDGETNFTYMNVNETFDSNVEFWKSYPAINGSYWWDIRYLNMSNSTSIVIWVNVTTCANGTTIENSVNVSNTTGTLLDTATCGPYTVAFSISKECNTTELTWNTTHLNYTINVTNIGDIFLDGILVNETYDNNISFYSANIVPYNVNQSFNFSDLAPGSTGNLYLRTNTTFGLTGEILVNQSKVYNNVSVKTNQTTPEVDKETYKTVGARTEALRISYRRDIPDLISTGNQVFAVIGAILILGTIFIIIYIMRENEGTNI